MVEQRDATIVMLVADRGPGVPLGQEARIFEKFHRLEQHHGIAGSGIGLSISKGIVEAHGGAIGVEQRPGGGAVFRMTLPIAGPPAAEQ
jgi:two-component system sensor histidine kinase KdpD